MPKHIYCSHCGMELEKSRKALKNRSLIIDMVAPHKCDEKYIGNITDADKPESAFAREMAERERTASAADEQRSDDSLLTPNLDRRSPDHLRKPVTSSAPVGILSTVKSAMPESRPERKMVDLDEGKEGDDSES